MPRVPANVLLRSALGAFGLALALTAGSDAWAADAGPSPQASADQGRTLLQGYRKDPSAHPEALNEALAAFTAAEQGFAGSGRKDEAAEAAANAGWCRRQLDRPEVKAALAARASASTAPAPAAEAGLPPTLFMRAEQPPAKAAAMPDEAACKPALEQLRGKFAKEYAKRSTGDRRAFAARLYQEAQKNRKDPAAFAAIVLESVRLSCESGDLVQTLQGIDRLAGSFAGCDAPALKKEWLQKSSARGMATVFASLLDKPQDAAGNLAAGRYAAVELGRWDDALPMLARGTPGPLAALAARDLAASDDALERVALAEDWLLLSRRGGTATPERIAWMQRAQHWFGAAKPDLEGLALDRVDQRLAEIDRQVPLDLERLDWAALTPAQWQKLPGIEQAVPIRVARSGPVVQLKEGQRVRIVAHPNDEWRIQSGSTPITTTWSGLAPKRQADGKPAPAPRGPYRAFRIGELLMQLGSGGDPARLGIIEGPGTVWLLPNRPEGDNEGKIRVKVVALDD